MVKVGNVVYSLLTVCALADFADLSYVVTCVEINEQKPKLWGKE